MLGYEVIAVWLRVARFIFSKKTKPSVKKAKNGQQNCWKKPNTELKRPKKSQTLHLAKPSLWRFASSQLNSHENTSCALTAPAQKAINSKLFLEFVTYDRKMPKFCSFSKTPKPGMGNHSVFSGRRGHSEKIFKSKIASNFPQQL